MSIVSIKMVEVVVKTDSLNFFRHFIPIYDEFIAINDYFYVKIKFIILWFLNLLFYLMKHIILFA